MGFLAGKRILVTGVLSNRSIAYGIARACHQQGAELAFTYVDDHFKDRVGEFAAEFGSKIVLPCDVAEDSQIEGAFTERHVKTLELIGVRVLDHLVIGDGPPTSFAERGLL